MSVVLRDLLAAGSRSPERIVPVPADEWSVALEAAAPKEPRAINLLAEFKRGLERAGTAAEVGIHAHQLAAVLDMPSAPKAPEKGAAS